MRILVVDDHELVRRGICSVLATDPGFTVCGEAVDGRDAVEKARALHPDVVVMDISMPNMNGLEATREIKRFLPETEIVIVSQHESPEMFTQASKAGARAYVVKSSIHTDLLEAIAKVSPHETGVKSPGMANASRSLDAIRQPTSDPFNLASRPPLIDFLPMAAYAVRAPDGVIAWYNSRAAELWGRTPVLGDTDERFCGAYKLYHPDGTYMAHCDTPVALALSKGVSVHEQDVVIEKPDGSRVTVSVHIDPIRDTDGSILGATNFFHDVTDRERAERTSGLLAAIVDSSDDAIVSKDLNGVIRSWNKGAERVFGYTAEEAIGQHISLIIPRERRGEEVAILEKLKRGERVDHFETVRVRKDGTLLDISVTISPMKDAQGRVIGASKVARDISERKQTEEVLRIKEHKLHALASELKNEVRLRTLALEERNDEVLQQSEQLRELSKRLLQTQDEERRRLARELHDSVGQIVAALSMNLSSIARQMGQNAALAKTVPDSLELVQMLNKEIRTMSYLLHPPLLDETGLSEAIRLYMGGLTERSGLKIELSIEEDFGRLPGEIELTVFRIVQECLTNIHRHSGSKTAAIRVSRNGDSVSLEIQDDGRGISPDKLAKIQNQRSGVGMTGMHERVRNLKGVMDIESNDKGTRISVTLPVSAFDSATQEYTASAVTPA